MQNLEINVLDAEGKVTGKAALPESMLKGIAGEKGVKVNRHLLHEVVRAYLANQRAGTHSSKTRTEVSGGGKKPWKQKHTGRARAGSSRSPLWRGGGIIFGPKPRSYRIDLPQAKIKAALRQALAAKASNGDLVVSDKPKLDQVKTKLVAAWLKKLSMPVNSLLVIHKKDEQLHRATRNLQNFSVMECRNLHPYDVLHAKKIIMTPEAVQCL